LTLKEGIGVKGGPKSLELFEIFFMMKNKKAWIMKKILKKPQDF
jgi:hypothetical protein